MKDEESPLLDDLKRQMKATSEEAIQARCRNFAQHFETKGSKLPFDYDPETGRFTAINRDYLAFVKEMSSIRSTNTKSRDFECRVATRLGQRVTGSIHRIGHPRDQKRRSIDFNAYLKTLVSAALFCSGRIH